MAEGPKISLIHLVPRFSPDVDGLGEYSLNLGHALLEQAQLSSEFIVWRCERVATEKNAGDKVERLSEPNAGALRQALERKLQSCAHPTLMVHYTSYSYSKEGLPVWLPSVLRDFKARGGRVICFFHELYAKGRFPNKTWMGSWLQKRIFREILELSEAAITSNAAYLEEIRKYASHSQPLVLAEIGSNVGELVHPHAWDTRQRRMVVFGLGATRMRLCQQHLHGLKKLAEHMKIDEIADIGSSPQNEAEISTAKEMFGGQLKIYGEVIAQQVSELLADSLVGVVNYQYDLRLKSGVVAAYQAHALPTLLFTPKGASLPCLSTDDALCAESVMAADGAQAERMLEKCATDGFNYYRKNRSYASVVEKILPILKAA